MPEFVDCRAAGVLRPTCVLNESRSVAETGAGTSSLDLVAFTLDNLLLKAVRLVTELRRDRSGISSVCLDTDIQDW